MTHAARIKANLGGTEMAHALKYILSMPKIPSYSRQVFLLTDGQVFKTRNNLKYLVA